MKRPWMPLYVAEYLADTGHLSAAEHGAYLLLIMHYWQKDGLPEDERQIARISRLTPAEWAESRDTLLELLSEKSWGQTSTERTLGVDRRPNPRPAIPTDIRRAVVSRDGGRCFYCGDTKGPFHLDHKMPWSRGGEHSVENLTVACQICNWRKGTYTHEAFIAGGLK